MSAIKMLAELDDYDWREVFKYGQPKRCKAGHDHRPRATIVSDVAETPFVVEDVKRVIAKVVGERDGAAWVCVGQLRDGRYFAIRASCDYTGWG